MHTAPSQDHRALGRLEQRDRLGDPLRIGQTAFHSPGTLLEEARWIIERVGLDVLRQDDRDRAGFGGIGQHSHRLR